MARLNGFSIFGGIVFIVVIILVIHPLTFRLPLPVSRQLRRLLSALRLIDHVCSDEDEVSRNGTAAGLPENGGVALGEAHEMAPLPLANKQTHSNDPSPSHSTACSAKKRVKVTIGLSSAPLLGVLLLLITTSIGGNEIKKGIVGEEGVKPYDVLVLFISLAYIATALDATGGLRYLAFTVALRAGSGVQLYFYLFFFFFISGAIIGNDPIILSGTPFLAYLTRVSGIVPPTAWIFAQFLAANVSSAILVSSNPTNVLVAGAFGLNYLSDFTKYTILPSLVAAIVAYPLLFFGFSNQKITHRIDKTAEGQLIPRTFVKPDVNPKEALVDPQGAVFHTTLLLVTLGVLVGTSFVPGGVEVWMVTLPGAVVGVIRDVIYDLTKHKTKRIDSPVEVLDADKVSGLEMDPKSQERVTLPYLWRRMKEILPNTSITLSRLPWPLLPFAVGMFILVRSLDRFGYISIFAEWTAKACTSPAAAVFFVGGIVALGLCPLCGTNIGATILAVEVLSNDAFLNAAHVQADPRILKGAIYAVALASNTGALVSLPSSLAGLLWSRILMQKGIRITQAAFSLINFIPVCTITFVGFGIVLVEVLCWN